MKVNIIIKNNFKSVLEKKTVEILQPINTIEELLIYFTEYCLKIFNQKKDSTLIKALSGQDILEKAKTGKVKFFLFNKNSISKDIAIENSKYSFLDGMIKIFIGGKEFTNLSESICLKENIEILFLKLTMLTG